jgi:hypothetical protein
MRTPAGSECPFYYADFNRGRNKQECRLIAPAPGRRGWTPDLCGRCAVPRIRMANACPNLIPEVGCGLCHEHVFQPKPPDKAA